MRTKVVIRNKFRFGVALFIMMLFVTTILMISIGEGKGIDKETDINWIFVEVKQGDSLWTISKNFVNESVDIRDYISFIRKVNRLENAVLYPGQVLKFVDVKTYKLLCSK
ncbi:LysM peptidoglycan-binding domain-containing protein [Anaerocellum danielii]|uniref:LysM peptidoglycan-binding domain-containing protein n=1 Tax=Anaerocellum danielii TaxID=1387557 RepID=A0ABZ0U5S0_9FIRM|nr:LysM peptidoglycan-binding domain-containing protein [Caldicellulosiruptor danielii]WPX10083.1 LysM peptidoglycan-binding domain-containing protein [Caldicellulosiruptor danielii]